jgi:hypothetical protein
VPCRPNQLCTVSLTNEVQAGACLGITGAHGVQSGHNGRRFSRRSTILVQGVRGRGRAIMLSQMANAASASTSVLATASSPERPHMPARRSRCVMRDRQPEDIAERVRETDDGSRQYDRIVESDAGRQHDASPSLHRPRTACARRGLRLGAGDVVSASVR